MEQIDKLSKNTSYKDICACYKYVLSNMGELKKHADWETKHQPKLLHFAYYYLIVYNPIECEEFIFYTTPQETLDMDKYIDNRFERYADLIHMFNMKQTQERDAIIYPAIFDSYLDMCKKLNHIYSDMNIVCILHYLKHHETSQDMYKDYLKRFIQAKYQYMYSKYPEMVPAATAGFLSWFF